MKALLFSDAFKTRCRKKEKFFTRKRILTFPVMVGCLLNMLTKTLQVELDRFLKVFAKDKAMTVTKQAFGKARKKFSEEAFILLNERLVDELYTENTYQTWKGYRVLGIDGSTVQLPMSEAILKMFGGVSNQHGLVMAMGRISALYDVLNEVTIDAALAPYIAGERKLACAHIQAVLAFDERTAGQPHLHQQDVLLFDMGYPALWFMAYLILIGKEFVIRTSTAFLKEVQDAIQAPEEDLVVRIPLTKSGRPLSSELKELVPDVDPTLVLSIRVLTLDLEDGQQEYLLTPLLDTDRFPSEDFRALYAKRWGSETNYDVLKNILEIENFTGMSPLSVRQDFHATVLTNTIRGLIHWDLQEEVAEENRSKPRKYAYQLNRNLSIGRLKDRIVTLMLDQGDLRAFYQDVKTEMKRNMVPIRPGRRFPRTRKNHRKYPLSKKRAL